MDVALLHICGEIFVADNVCINPSLFMTYFLFIFVTEIIHIYIYIQKLFMSNSVFEEKCQNKYRIYNIRLYPIYLHLYL